MYLSRRTFEVAHHMLGHIEPAGDIMHLAVPVPALDPTGIRLWAELPVGDADLAEVVASGHQKSADLLAAWRTQPRDVVSVLGR